MSHQINIFVNYFEKNKFIKYNTDISYLSNFKLLADEQMRICFNNSHLSLSHFIIFYSLQSLTNKIKIDLTRYNLFYKYLKTVYNQSAHFTNPNAIEQIENGLKKMITEQGYRLELAANAYAHFQNKYSFEVVSTYYQELFKETISAGKAAVNNARRVQ